VIKEFQYTFEELGIIAKDLGELMGFVDGVIPDPFPEVVNNALVSVPSNCSIRGGYKIFNSNETQVDKATITISGHVFYPTKIITTQFEKASTLVLFICTAGPEISKLSKRISDDGDPLLGYVYDVIGSLTVEKAMDKVQKELESECLELGLKVSDRFSPGYCDWSVSDQQKLFALMPENFCGVTLSESSLMSPIKSVSGIIAIGNQLKQKGYQCRWCSDKNCMYGKIKRQKKI